MPLHNPVRRCAVLGAVAVLALAGCADHPGGGTENVAEDQAALVELSERLTGAEDHAYTAQYLLESSGDEVTVAIDPEEGTGAVVIEDKPELWSGDDADALPGWVAVKLTGMLPSVQEVAAWLSATAEDPSATAEFSDTTLAGELADCVKVRGAANSPVGAYNVCLTTLGVIASVTAEVGKTTYTAKLVNYHDGVDGAWLDELARTNN